MKKVSSMLVSKNLKWLMGERISPYALASVTGVPQPTIFRILTGESNDPRTGTLQPLAKYFGVTVADLRDRDLELDRSSSGGQEMSEAEAPPNKLSEKQQEWLSLLDHLGSDDVAEFIGAIRSRQARNLRLLDELRADTASVAKREKPLFEKSGKANTVAGKKQSSQSS